MADEALETGLIGGVEKRWIAHFLMVSFMAV